MDREAKLAYMRAWNKINWVRRRAILLERGRIYRAKNRAERREKRLAKYRENPEKFLERTRAWRKKSHDKILAYDRNYWSTRRGQQSRNNRRKYLKHGEELRQRTREYRIKNPEKAKLAIKRSMDKRRDYYMARSREMGMKERLRLRVGAIGKLGGSCVKCGYSKDIRALQIDHINNDGFKERKERGGNFGGDHRNRLKNIIANGGQGRFQLLCANCNWIKHIEFRKSLRSNP